jgi:hypothetical protein
MTEHYAPGDKVTIVRGVSPKDKVVGRSGTVNTVFGDELVSVKGVENKLIEALLGERAYRPDQLRKT